MLQLRHNTAKYIHTYCLKKDQWLACTEPSLWNLWQVLQWRDKSTDFIPVRDDISSDTASQVWPRIPGVHWRKAGAYTHRWGGKPLVLARLLWSNIRTSLSYPHLPFIIYVPPASKRMWHGFQWKAQIRKNRATSTTKLRRWEPRRQKGKRRRQSVE